jgi:single-strand DNA-binding protein
MAEAHATIAGNVGTAPKLIPTRTGTDLASFRLASTPRWFDRGAQEWKDGETLWIGVSCWRALARNVADSLRPGDAVIVHGRLVQRSYTDRTQEARTVIEIEASTVGPDLTRGTAPLTRTSHAERSGAGAGARTGADAWSNPVRSIGDAGRAAETAA